VGVSVEDQARADERVPELLQTIAAVRFLSVEPLLGPVLLEPLWRRKPRSEGEWLNVVELGHKTPVGIDWVICGGESGPGARPDAP
jgi:protein gp37